MSQKSYNFFRGHPSANLLPSKEVCEAANTIFQKVIENENHYDDVENRHPLAYGPDLGNLEVREVICAWNQKQFELSSPCDPQCIDLTNGASYGVMNILAQTTSPHNGITRRAFLVTPTYFLINGAFIDAGFGGRLSGVEELSDGQIDLESLEKQLIYYDSLQDVVEPSLEDIKSIQHPKKATKKIFRYVIYVTPTFSNPRGGTLSLESRRKLVEIARRYDMLIISDDVYDLLDYSVPANQTPKLMPRMVHVDRDSITDPESFGNTVSNASFSKLVGPGIRVGWQESPTPALTSIISKGGAHISGGSPSHTNSMIVGELIRSGSLDRIVVRLREEYSKRSKALILAVENYLPEGTVVSGGDGGYFLWAQLPEGYDCRGICKECAKRGVILANGDHFEVEGDYKNWGTSGVRLCISFMPTESIVEAVKIWGEVCKEFGITSQD